MMNAQHPAAFDAATATHQNSLNSQSYTLLNRPAMVVGSQAVRSRIVLISFLGNGCLDEVREAVWAENVGSSWMAVTRKCCRR